MSNTTTAPAGVVSSKELGQASEEWNAPDTEAAYAMGANGGPVVESERLAFEAWMRGHCWALGATWRGTQYRSDDEASGDINPHAMRTRQLWAAWRDRAALAKEESNQMAEAERAAMYGTFGGR